MPSATLCIHFLICLRLTLSKSSCIGVNALQFDKKKCKSSRGGQLPCLSHMVTPINAHKHQSRRQTDQ